MGPNSKKNIKLPTKQAIPSSLIHFPPALAALVCSYLLWLEPIGQTTLALWTSLFPTIKATLQHMKLNTLISLFSVFGGFFAAVGRHILHDLIERYFWIIDIESTSVCQECFHYRSYRSPQNWHSHQWTPPRWPGGGIPGIFKEYWVWIIGKFYTHFK